MFVTWLNICYFFTFNKVFTSSVYIYIYIYITLIKIKGFLTPNHDSQKKKKKNHEIQNYAFF